MSDSFGDVPDRLRGLTPASKARRPTGQPRTAPGGKPFQSRDPGASPSWTSNRGGSPILSVTGPPVWVLAVAGVLGSAGLVLGVAGWNDLALPLAGWFLAGIGAFGAVAAFLVIDSNRRGQAGYSTTSLDRWLYRIVITVALVGLLVCAAGIGLYVGRQ